MSDHQQSQRPAAAQSGQQLQHLCTQSQVQCRDGFIAYQHLGFDDQCACDGHALRLPSRQLAAAALQESRVHADCGQLFDHAIAQFRAQGCTQAGAQGIGHQFQHSEGRIQ